MKKLLRYIFILFATLVILGCERKTLYLRAFASNDRCEVVTTLNIDASLQIMTDVNLDIQNNLLYDWNEQLYGPLGYTIPTSIHGVFFKTNEKGKRVVETESDFTVGIPKRVMIETNTQYYALFYNNTYRTYYEYYQSYMRYICYPDRKLTKSFDFEETFEMSEEPEEQFSVYKEFLINPADNDVTFVQDENSMIYHYKMSANLTPVSYIYIIQVKIEDDDETKPMLIDSVSTMVINGIPKERELFTIGTTRTRCQIMSNNVKPLIFKDNYAIFAERFITYGLMKNADSSWSEDMYVYELGMLFHAVDGRTKEGKVNISQDYMSKPYGGVITVTLKNSAIYDFFNDDNERGITVDVEDWVEVFDVEIEI